MLLGMISWLLIFVLLRELQLLFWIFLFPYSSYSGKYSILQGYHGNDELVLEGVIVIDVDFSAAPGAATDVVDFTVTVLFLRRGWRVS